MKKILFIVVLFALVFIVVISCSKNNEIKNCTDLISKVNAAEITYGVNPSTANCQAYKMSLNNLLGCSYITAQEKAAYKLLFDQLTC